MRLLDLHRHFDNHYCCHLNHNGYNEEAGVYTHALYKNLKNRRVVTIPIHVDDVDDELVEVACVYLDIPLPVGLFT